MKGFKNCPACDTANGTRAVTCSKCGEKFRGTAKGPRPKLVKEAPAEKPEKKPKSAGGVLDLVEALASAEARLCAFEQMDDLDVIIGEIRTAKAIARELGR